MTGLFDYLNAINHTKEDIIGDSEDPVLAEKGYEPFLINRGLSFFPDTIFYANEMNHFHMLDKYPQFKYLLNTVRPKKRFSKWFKDEKSDDVVMISELYQLSKHKAKEVVSMLSSEQLEAIHKKIEKGG